MHVLLWLLVLCSSGLAMLLTPVFLAESSGAPGQAAGAAIGVAMAAIPYCLARAWDEMTEFHKRSDHEDAEVAAKAKGKREENEARATKPRPSLPAQPGWRRAQVAAWFEDVNWWVVAIFTAAGTVLALVVARTLGLN